MEQGFPLRREREGGYTITHITEAPGTVQNEYSYDAWGRRRNFTNWTYTVAAQTDLLPGRGFTGHEWLPWFNLYNMNGRLYDPLVGRFLSPDNNVQMPDYTQNFNRYSYCLNNPLKYTDPDGEWVHIVVGAAIGGLINLGVKAYQGKINSWGDGFAAFGIGAVAGAVGAATGGAAFTLAGGGAAGAGGFFAGAAGGMAGTAFASPFQSFGNSAYFGDPMMTGKQYLTGIAFGGLTGGTINGSIALSNGRSFWAGLSQTKPTFTPAPVPAMKFNEPAAKLNTDGMRSKMLDMPSDMSRDLPLEGSVPELTLKLPNPEVNFVDRGISVIGPRSNYREFAKRIGANFLDVKDEAWTMRKNVEFLQGVVKRGDDVIFSGKFNPLQLDPNSVLGQEIRYLQRHGYSWTDDFSKLIKR